MTAIVVSPVENLLEVLRKIHHEITSRKTPRDTKMQAVHEFRGAYQATVAIMTAFGATNDERAEVEQLWADVHAVKVSLKAAR